ncbi:MAG: MFS transporter [Burkholderiaceae bacterium]|nr:MFS transporter [Burkholderiaceae bacterium]
MNAPPPDRLLTESDPHPARAASVVGGPLVMMAGIIAAMHVGKLPTALTAIRDTLGMSLVQASFLVALFALASAVAGVLGGGLADRFGHRHSMIAGQVLLAAGSIGGAFSQGAGAMLASRSLESLGFMLAVLPGPAMLARVLAPAVTARWMGAWGAYMPTGFSLALLLSPLVVSMLGWRSVWIGMGVVSLAWAVVIHRLLPFDRLDGVAAAAGGLRTSLGAVVSRRGPWLLALAFGFYAAQYTSIFAFLPTMYEEAGIGAAAIGALTALAAGINLFGNVGAGLLAHRGVPARGVIVATSAAMALLAYVAFGSGAGFAWRYGAVTALSLIAGLIPGTLFGLAPRLAPTPSAAAGTVGLMQQGSGLGQLLMPPVVAWLAASTGGWDHTWWATGAFASIVAYAGWALARCPGYGRR